MADRTRAPPELHGRLQGDVVAGRGTARRASTSRPPIRASTRPARSSGTTFAPLGTRAGTLRPEAAQAIGLPESVAVAVGNVDSFVSVPGAGVEQPGTFVMVIGTSICDMVVDPREVRLPGITGVVRDGILPGLYGYEAGQAAVGDMLAWFVDDAGAGAGGYDAARAGGRARFGPGETGLVALDWWNGNRTILADADLTGAIFGLTLQSTPERDLPRAARVDRVRQPPDHGQLRGARPRAVERSSPAAGSRSAAR